MARRPKVFERFATVATVWTGTSWAFIIALAAIVVWGVTGPLFRYSDTWQLVINTSTTIVTFLMVFLIQRSQNKDAMAIQLKLNELVAAVEGASNRLICIEDLSEDEVKALHRHYQHLVELAKQDQQLTHSHSVEEARGRHRFKLRWRKARAGVPAAESGPGPAASHDAIAEAASGAVRRQANGRASAHEEEPAGFLDVARRLQERVQENERRLTEHQAEIEGLKELLARHGFPSPTPSGNPDDTPMRDRRHNGSPPQAQNEAEQPRV
jgi:low affinity Fe/Cu permease